MGDELEDAVSDRRKEHRWNIPVPVHIRDIGADATDFQEETVTADASPSGMCILLTSQLQKGDQVLIDAPDEGFESSGSVVEVSSGDLKMRRVHVQFPCQKRFGRAAAKKKYVYDYSREDWVGYILDGVYYNSKHQPFGKFEGHKVLSLDSGNVLFSLQKERLFDRRMNCLGHMI